MAEDPFRMALLVHRDGRSDRRSRGNRVVYGAGDGGVRAMKLLYITEDMPNRDPVFGDGSSMIPFEILRNLPDDVAVTLLTYAGPVGLPDELRDRCEAVHVVAPRPRSRAMARSVLGLNGLGMHERDTAEAVSASAELSAQNDATLIHGPHVLFLARHLSGPLVLQTVDPWSIRTGMDRALAPRILRAAYRLREFQALRAEGRLPARARLLTVGAQDALDWSERLGRRVRSIPNGAEHAVRPASRPGPPVVCFVGSLNYGPNIDSVKVLIGKIAPMVWEQVPEAKFVVAGRQPDSGILDLSGPLVEVLANVPSVVEVFHGADVAVFPDEHGVGIRNSVREALAAGTPVVATPVAAREQEPHPMLFVAEDPDELVALVVDRLTASRTESGRNTASPYDAERGTAAVRTWKDAAREYMEELRTAIGDNDLGVQHPIPPRSGASAR
ncbi:glycosyltransferase [Sinomonas sp. JGH33]|uniref:Glycosyltransferase n=1 Tax=Sinomonas terricola TaxID=3110330 RepID=A0ABU5TAX8_9MICC|nr:glycosyltransferase [Sinomonas sp. JGH33]MEA5456665.1 glycosyltransferase [Sinomonas sp. JGH33]